jgi:hypothetical protein
MIARPWLGVPVVKHHLPAQTSYLSHGVIASASYCAHRE